MRYMSWSYDQLMVCPDHYIAHIYAVAEEEKREAEDEERRRNRI
jgi:hypothetical protein